MASALVVGFRMTIDLRELSPDAWPDLERLFGQRGACGGCWCMSWRCPDGERWEELKGEGARERQRVLVEAGRSHGVLAYAHGQPVAWVAFGPRLDFPKLGRARTLACDDAERVWSVPCFFITKEHRGQGLSKRLLAAAVASIRARGGDVIEGYPVRVKPGSRSPAAFVWTGLPSTFAALGFVQVGDPNASKLRMRLVG